ncbi:MAG: hypothetical protein P8N62_02785 [Alphaproteobacteria bacterium]|nr:hypothetical protein [Alphaproteobacteria bacterium]
MEIRIFHIADTQAIIALWKACGLVQLQNQRCRRAVLSGVWVW